MADHPITPPPELVQQWCHEDGDEIKTSPRWYQIVATKAARWGADQELEACCEYLTRCAAWEPEDVAEFLDHRRPKPPSLKEQALRILVENGTTLDGRIELEPEDIPIIRRALEALDD